MFMYCVVYDWERTDWLLTFVGLDTSRLLTYLGNGNILSHGLVKYYLVIYYDKILIQIIFTIILGYI